ncbi:multidrug effflux MFS transporter [Candidatus Nephthysia bennettiae]|uniref:Multidrug effflux MFS transporter n=1 Tax=Candidatus Nephthysia bennettiae TaxID=3127016 RepID=A0A934K3D4_9BACT|nr:multidrug effflux MFS transporter [Candidatus Dormibacteraeota bacterium]MBJ7613464.1 multidrug effflux MFS transporter [Candidatus Dormibacteraeota bacterium]
MGISAVGEEKRAPASRARLVLILGSLSAFGPLSLDMYLPGLPALAQDLQTGAAQAQVTLTGCLVGLAVGQLVVGSISDSRGRRLPLLLGLGGYAATSLLCAVTPSIYLLIVLRLLQGMAGGAGIVIARAVVRDLYSGVAAARFYALLMLVNGLAPILAPVFGSQLLRVSSWRGVFVTLGLIGAVLLAVAAIGLPETLPPERRTRSGLLNTLRTFRMLLADREFLGCALTSGCAIGAMFAYIAGSPFVLEGIYGVSPQGFSLVFGANALGLVVTAQLSARLVGRIPPVALMTAGVAMGLAGGLTLLLVVLAGGLGLVAVLPALFLVVASIGLVMPNATALALARHARVAGSGSALLGLAQFIIGGAVAPLVGIGGSRTALPMAIVIATLGTAALVACLTLVVPAVRSASDREELRAQPELPRETR